MEMEKVNLKEVVIDTVYNGRKATLLKINVNASFGYYQGYVEVKNENIFNSIKDGYNFNKSNDEYKYLVDNFPKLIDYVDTWLNNFMQIGFNTYTLFNDTNNINKATELLYKLADVLDKIDK